MAPKPRTPERKSGQSERQPTAEISPGRINGIDVDEMQKKVDAISADPDKGVARFQAKTNWTGGLKSDSYVDSWHLGGERIDQDYHIQADEPVELVGEGTAPNPQMLLQAAINSCMLNTFVAAASVMGVELESLEFESRGELDLRGFLGIDESVDAGYSQIDLTIRVKGDGTPEQYEKMYELVERQSPNYFNTTQPIALNAEIVVED